MGDKLAVTVTDETFLLANSEYFLYLTKRASGYSGNKAGELLTAMGDHQATDDSLGRFLYLRDQDTAEVWSLAGQASGNQPETTLSYQNGRLSFTTKHQEIECQVSVYVPTNDPVELWEVTVQNTGSRKRRLSLFFALEWAPIFTGANFYHDTQALVADIRTRPELAGFVALDHPVDSWEIQRSRWLGALGNWQKPAALAGGKLTRVAGNFKNGQGVAVLQKNLSLGGRAGLKLGLTIGLSSAESPSWRALVKKYNLALARRQAVEQLAAELKKRSERSVINSPVSRLNEQYNQQSALTEWLADRQPSLTPYGCRPVQRPADPIQLAKTLLSTVDERPADQLKGFLIELVGFQQRQGALGTIIDQQLSATVMYLEAIAAVLLETAERAWWLAPFDYAGGGSATLAEHVNRAIKYLAEALGDRSLLINAQDEQLIESSAHWLVVLQRWQPLFEQLSDHHQAHYVGGLINKMSHSLAECWSSNGFPAIKTANKMSEPLGLSAQLWPVLAGVATEVQVSKIIKTLDRFRQPNGWGNIDKTYPKFITSIAASADLPGYGGNGGINLADNLLLAKFWRRTKNPQKIVEILEQFSAWPSPDFLPATGAIVGSANWASANSSHWRQLIREELAGVSANWGGLKIDPCLPKDWPSMSLNRYFRGAQYHIRIHNPLRRGQGVDRIIVDGDRLTGQVITPFRTGEHLVEVFLG